MKEALKTINDAMNELGVNYSFMKWEGVPQYPYFTGEYQETGSLSEDGMKEATVILNGFHRGETWDALTTAVEKIEWYFGRISGKMATTRSGVVAIFYENTLVIPTESAEFMRMQINLTIKKWSNRA